MEHPSSYVRASELDDALRALIAPFVTPRRALDGELVWPIEEIDGAALEALEALRRTVPGTEPCREAPGATWLPGDAGATPTPATPRAPGRSLTDDLAAYRARAANATDPIDREVARRQRDRLARATSRPAASTRPASRWRHVPLGALFEAAGNRLHARSTGQVECGHEPFHGSKSGRCVLIDPTTGWWWCRSCRQGGDAATFLMRWRGWTYRQAAAWLTARYGPPPDVTPETPRRSLWREVRL
jgi:hypothetical protein